MPEGIHSLVDTGNQSLILLGIHRSKKPADDQHPYGYGKELRFCATRAKLATRPGTTWCWRSPLLESAASYLALKALLAAAVEKSFWHALRSRKDPAVFTILAEDFAALAGIGVAFLGIYFGHLYGNPYLDGMASVAIGVILALVAVFLVYESRGLIIGESADIEIVRSVHTLAQADPAVHRVERPLTMHLGARQVLLNMRVVFRADLSAIDLPAALDIDADSLKKTAT